MRSSSAEGVTRGYRPSWLSSPWLWLAGRRPTHMLAANVMAFLATLLFAVVLLGGYARERDTHPTALTDTLELFVFCGAVAALSLAVACYERSPRTWARTVAVAVLVLVWPILAVLTVITLQAKL